ncbi:hypothetical protein F7734_37975 [Scytonema sp. UIC 10036]|uniref:hypothetical protein n=1 Tax=Scytonema sp. UIC 10036 TaxID=2304196 RepID=UPI0012DA6FC2|nr:hypothetical protein [Scytonema sp. UIC 10036]MUG97790.1 hypothetical protein [Scytonema sp. UIC 10036]
MYLHNSDLWGGLANSDRTTGETSEGIYGGGTYSDLPLATTYYPNDNAQAKDPKSQLVRA